MRKAEVTRNTNETQISVKLDLDGDGQGEDRDRRAVSRSHAGAGRAPRRVRRRGHARRAICTSTRTTPWRTSASRSARRSPRRSATRRACAATATPTCRSTRRCRAPSWICPGGPGSSIHIEFARARIGEFDVDLVHEFFQGFVNHAQVTLHVDNLKGANAHHQAETAFKAFGARAAHGGRSSTRG